LDRRHGDDTIGSIRALGAPDGDKNGACVKADLDKIANQLK